MVDSVGARGSVPTNNRRQQALANGERACDRMPLHQQSNVNEKCLFFDTLILLISGKLPME